MAKAYIGIKGWRNYSTFSLFAAGSQRADRQTSVLVDTFSGNLSVLATDWILAARVPCAITRAYNHQDSDSDPAPVDRPFGPGWYWQFDMNLTGGLNNSGTVTWKSADGSEYDFTESGGSYTAPAGMNKCNLTYSAGSPALFTLKSGRMEYGFKVNNTDDRARLMYIRDAYGNGLEIVRAVDGNSEPTATIQNIRIRWWKASISDWDLQTIITPTYDGTRITRLDLKYLDSGNTHTAIKLHYSYDTIDGELRLTLVEPKDGSDSALSLEVAYSYDASEGLQMTRLYDSVGHQEGTPYYWQATYSSNKVATVVFPVESGTTGTVSYNYAPGAPTSWGHDSPNSWTKITDARSKQWYYGHHSDGSVQFAVDPLWVNSTHESYSEYAYNTEHQVIKVETPKPNAESGQAETFFYYDDHHNLAAVKDAYGFISWYKYGTRASYATSGTEATFDDVIGIFTPMPNQAAYGDSDHTASETVIPSGMSDPADVVDISDYLDWDDATGHKYWYYDDGHSPTPTPIKLVLTRIDYQFSTGTGRLEMLLSCSPENFYEAGLSTHDPADVATYALDGNSACTCQVFGTIASGTVPTASITVTSGDLMRSYAPRQFKDSNLKWTAFTYDATYGVVTEVENADSLAASAGKKTKYTYNAIKTRVTKVEQPQDSTNQWIETIYSDNLFATQIKRKDIGSWGVDPIVAISAYDNNGNLKEAWQADPAYTSTPRWNGVTGNGYDKVRAFNYDRVNRTIQSNVAVNLDHVSTLETLITYFKYDLNGNVIRVIGPAYTDSGTKYTYNFTDYDDANRVSKVYVTLGDASDNLTAPPGGTKYTGYEYDLAGNVKKITEPLYDGNASTTKYATAYTYDWLNRQIMASQGWTNYASQADSRATEQHFDAAGGVLWSQDGEGFRMYPIRDKDGRLSEMHRGTSTGDNDLREYNADGQVEFYYSYQDVEVDSLTYRTRNEYDLMGRLVNSGRERKVSGTWQDWNENTADTTFNYNGAVLRTYDKVISGKYTERTYDDWGQLKKIKAPAVDNPADPGHDIVYETEYFYDVLGRRSSVDDARDNSTSYSYDTLGRLISVVDALMYTTVTYFDARGNRSQVTTSAGASYAYTYNGRGLLSTQAVTHDSTTDTTTYSYDDNGRLAQINYPDGGITTFEYDELGRRMRNSVLLQTGMPDVYLDTLYQYDDDNRMTKLTIPGSYQYNYTFDDLGNMTKSEDTHSDDTDFTYDKNNRLATKTDPNGLVITNSYDWKTGSASAVLYERNTTSGDDITVSYGYDDNGRVTSITDGRGYTWAKSYDAMGRMLTLVTPNPGGGAYTHTIIYDGTNNMTKTVDFKGTAHYYQYDDLNRMTGHGHTSAANDETYTYICCNQMTAYTDARGTADIDYDQLMRVTSFTDSNGNNTAYVYDSMSRVTRLTPPQGSSYKTEYGYKKNGALDYVDVYDAGSSARTAYTYDTTTGKLTQRNFPTVSSQNIRTTNSYDSAGRLEYETVTREAGGTTNLYKTQYAYSWIAAASGGGRQLERIEQVYSGGAWGNDNKLTYKYDSLEREYFEQRHDWVLGAWASKFDTTQEYDKNGNRTRYHRNLGLGAANSYGRNEDLSYTFNNVNQLTQVTDADDATYQATVTCDANNNITQIDERMGAGTMGNPYNYLYTYFEYDDLNRLLVHKDKRYVAAPTNAWVWTKRSHGWDAIGRLEHSNYKTWNDGSQEPAGNSLEHCYAGSRHVQNFDGTSTYGAVWHWAGASNEHNAPLRSPNPDTASQNGYNTAVAGGAGTPQRRTFLNPTTEGNKRELFAQGRPEAKDSSGAGANWYLGTQSAAQSLGQNIVESRFFFQGTVVSSASGADLSRATDTREKYRQGVFGTSNSYAGSYGRVTSEPIGRDLNPLGRGSGRAFVAGLMDLGRIAPRLPYNRDGRGQGNSINNDIAPNPGDYGGGIDDSSVYTPPANALDCCRCQAWACCRISYANAPVGEMPRAACCCPEECGDECVGEGGPMHCGNGVIIDTCHLINNPCNNFGLPGGGTGAITNPGGGCPGCGGSGNGDIWGPMKMDVPHLVPDWIYFGIFQAIGDGRTTSSEFVYTDLEMMKQKLIRCLDESVDPNAAGLANALRRSRIALWSHHVEGVWGLYIPLPWTSGDIYIDPELYEEYSECDIMQTILHEASHRSGKYGYEGLYWPYWWLHERGFISDWAWNLIRNIIYDPAYNPAVANQSLVALCCCSNEPYWANRWHMNDHFLPPDHQI